MISASPSISAQTGVLEVSATRSRLYCTLRHDLARKGVGDVFSALTGAGLVADVALGQLVAPIDSICGAPHLSVADGIGPWRDAAPAAYRDI